MRKSRIYISILVLSAVVNICFAQSSKTEERTTQKEVKVPAIDSSGAASKRFVGTWKLILMQLESPEGEISYPMGHDASGLLMYDDNGNIALQVMRSGRPVIDVAKPGLPPEDEKAIVSGYTALYGTYDVNEADKTITYHIQASLAPSLTGKDLVRSFEFIDNKLVIKTPPPKTEEQIIRLYVYYERAK